MADDGSISTASPFQIPSSVVQHLADREFELVRRLGALSGVDLRAAFHVLHGYGELYAATNISSLFDLLREEVDPNILLPDRSKVFWFFFSKKNETACRPR